MYEVPLSTQSGGCTLDLARLLSVKSTTVMASIIIFFNNVSLFRAARGSALSHNQMSLDLKHNEIRPIR
ncbi:hypothetical protein RSAG8_06621, partial [Rhizoctonia solani AG-8 WAC10335]